MKTVKEFKNNLMKRREVVLDCEYDSNPGKEKVSQDVASQFKSSPECVVVRKIGSSFGTNSFVIDSFVYDSVEDKDRIERKKKEKKKK